MKNRAALKKNRVFSLKQIKRLLSAVVLLNLLWGGQIQAAEMEVAGKRLICPEDEMTVIRMSSDPLHTELYDCYGNYVDAVNYPTGMGGITTVKEGKLFASEENGERIVYRIGDPVMELVRVPADTCKVQTGEGWYGVSTRNAATDFSPQGTWNLQLFDEAGTCFYDQVICDVSTPTYRDDYRVWMIDGQYYISWYSEFYMDEKEEGNPNYSYTHRIDRIDITSKGGTEIYSSNIKDDDWFRGMRDIKAFGSYLFIPDIIIDTNGNVLLEDVHYYGEWIEKEERNDEDDSLLAVTIYDSDLQKTELPDETVQRWNEEHHGSIWEEFVRDGMILGLKSEKLNGRVCDGWFTEGGPAYIGNYLLRQIEKRWVPYTRIENEGILALIDGKLVSFYMTEDEIPVSFNDDFYVTRIKEKGYRYDLVRSRRSGEILLSGNTIRMQRNLESYDYICFYLEESYIMETSMAYDTEVNVYRLSQDHTEKEELEKTKIPGRYAAPWCKDLIYLRRGAYMGLADYQGNWVVKLTGVNM